MEEKISFLNAKIIPCTKKFQIATAIVYLIKLKKKKQKKIPKKGTEFFLFFILFLASDDYYRVFIRKFIPPMSTYRF